MIRFVFRFLGLVLLALAFILFVYDGTRSIAANAVFISKTSDIWSNIHQSSLLKLQPMIEGTGIAWLWDPVTVTFLAAPSWLVLAILAAILIVLGRKKKPLIGYARN